MTGPKSTVSRIIAVLMILSLLLSLLPLSLAAQGPVQRATRPLPERVPQEVLDFFGDGISAEEFVARTGYVPRALEGVLDKDVLVIIQLEQQPAALVYAEARASGEPMAQGALDNYRRALDVAQADVMSRAAALGVREISRYNTVYNGIQATVPASRLADLARVPGVVSVRRAPIHTPSLSASVPLIGADAVRFDLGFDGEGIVIGVIDTGIDYTHATFGGSGDPADYADNDPSVREVGTFPTVKVIGGYDFAGSDYDADSSDPDMYTPHPDNDPLDENGHGTHVASTAAGIGSTQINHGVAPAAGLIAYKVFGRAGSTSLTMDALEMATEDYIVYGFPDVINMSLGSPFGAADPLDPDVAATDAASAVGIMVVTSAGNEGPYSYITGSPGVASTALSVAATTTGYVTGPTVQVTDDPLPQPILYQPPAFDGGTGMFETEITATLGWAGALPGATDDVLCTLTGGTGVPLLGKIALIQRGGCDFYVKVNNAAALGAVGALIYNHTVGGNAFISMSGSPVTIPAGFIWNSAGLALIPFDGESVTVSAYGDTTAIPNPYTPADVIASFSSQGPRGYDSALKPEIAAPGVSIYAADMGSGIGGVSMSGTSMAAPHVAGVAALVRQAHPAWTPEMVKAAIMNTGVDLADGTTIPRAGAGRVDAYAAVSTDVLAIADDDLVSQNWGVVYNNAMTETLHGQIRVSNTSTSTITSTLTFAASAALQSGSRTNGVTGISVSPSEPFELNPGHSTVIDVNITLDMSAVDMAQGTLEGYFGYITIAPALGGTGAGTGPEALGSGPSARVPFYFAPRPYASLTITGDDTITHPIWDWATLDVVHEGSIPSSLWAYPALVATDAPNPDVSPNGSVRMFGMDYGWNDDDYGDMIAVAIDAWAPWHVPQPYFSEFDLYVDPDDDGDWDYLDFNFNYGWASTGADDNTWVVVQVDLATNMLYLASPYTLTSDYNSSFMEWYLSAAWHDLGPTNTDFGYQLVGWDQYGTPDPTGAGSFDYADLPLLWDYDGDPGPGSHETTFWAWVNKTTGYNLAEPLGLMIVDYNGDPNNSDGAQAYLAPIDVFYKHLFWFPFMARSVTP